MPLVAGFPADVVPAGGPPLHLLAIGVDAGRERALRRAGHDVTSHALDRGPVADLRGRPFTPPVNRWPFPDAAFDRVILEEDLAHVVADEIAIAEAARVLRPGGKLLIRVPQAGPLAWLDGYNVYRYARDFTKRGQHLHATRGIGWRRHYPRRDLARLLAPAFSGIRFHTSGIGLTEVFRIVVLLIWSWLLRRPDGDAPARPALRRIDQLDRRLSAGPLGYHLVAIAERTPPAA